MLFSKSDLHAALTDALRYSPHYGQGMSNHSPMVLHALHELGATQAEVAVWLGGYVGRLSPATAPVEAIANERWEATLREFLLHFMPGASGAAFHGLIRLAHAHAGGHAHERAAALAYARHVRTALLPVAPEADTPKPLDWSSWWQAAVGWAAQANALNANASARSIQGRMAAAAKAPGYFALCVRAPTPCDANAPSELAGLAIQAASVYCQTRNFTVLHAVTSAWALHELLRLTPSAGQTVHAYAGMLLAGLAAAQLRPQPECAPQPPAHSWEQLAKAACQASDDHTAKLVFAAKAWSDAQPHPVFRLAAEAAVLKSSKGSTVFV
jgi:hypothetical protein